MANSEHIEYKHKESGKKLILINSNGIVGRFEVVGSEVKQRHMRFGRKRIVCLFSNVEPIKMEGK